MSMCFAVTDADWSLTKDFFSVIGTLVSAVGVGVAFYIGKKGLAAWEKQLKGTDDHNFSKAFLVEIYAFKKMLVAGRQKFLTGEELSDPPDLTNIEPGVRAYARRNAGFSKRVSNIGLAQTKIHDRTLVAEALWGKEIYL